VQAPNSKDAIDAMTFWVNQIDQTDQTDLSRLPSNLSVQGEMLFSYLTGTKQTR